jgi:hypothetical protein
MPSPLVPGRSRLDECSITFGRDVAASTIRIFRVCRLGSSSVESAGRCRHLPRHKDEKSFSAGRAVQADPRGIMGNVVRMCPILIGQEVRVKTPLTLRPPHRVREDGTSFW